MTYAQSLRVQPVTAPASVTCYCKPPFYSAGCKVHGVTSANMDRRAEHSTLNRARRKAATEVDGQ